MPARKVSTHNLRENKAERTPHRIMIFDTESTWQNSPGGELHTLDCWAARQVIRHPLRRPQRVREGCWEGTTGEELADLLEEQTGGPDTLWLFAHNLSFDLALTRLPLLLLWRGWELGQQNLASEAPWAFLRRGSRTLRLADSWSWLPVSVRQLALDYRVPRPRLPDLDAGRAQRLRRCRADVEAVTRALLGLMDEWERRGAGAWSLTGPATAWNSMLHTRHPAKVVIDPDPRARAAERRAIYSGMREVGRAGELPPSRYLELDFSRAHLQIARELLLPRRRQAHFDRLALDDWRLRNRFEGLIARVRLRTESPRYPLRLRDGVIHPVGEFWTDLCKPEIVEAAGRGELVEIGPGWAYSLGDRMRDWAELVSQELEGPPDRLDPAWRHFRKMSSRAVPGRWGMLTSEEEPGGPSPVLEWHLEEASFGREGRRGYIVHLAGRWFRVIREQEGEDSFPAVLAYIQSWTRVLLMRAIDELGEGEVLSRNTDQLWIRHRRLRQIGVELRRGVPLADRSPEPEREALDHLARLTWPLRLRIKGSARTLEVLSPQHVRANGRARFAGIPGNAEETEPGTFEFLTWPKLASQLRHGELDGYLRQPRRVRVAQVPLARWVFRCGCTMPPRAALSGPAGWELMGPDLDSCPLHGEPLRGSQRRSLRLALEPLRLAL